MAGEVDVLAALVSLLVDEGLAGGYVFGEEVPASVASQMPRAAIEIGPSGGTGYASAWHLDTQRVDVRSYGQTPAEARAVALEVHQVLDRLWRRVVDGVLLHSAIPSGGFLSDREPDTRWPYTFRAYSVLYDRRPVIVGGSGS